MEQPRQQWEQKERLILAPYAQFSADSHGRRHAEPAHPFRSEYQRDRDRIIHCTAFRRLEYKTQVVLNGTGDHFRTRLTHTIEVAAISRTTARTLGLNEDLAEAIALAHDLGHPPFGHPGEHTLNELMRDHGGFEHNRQSLRVVDELELKYPKFNGLNLTRETREGLDKHGVTVSDQPALEAQITDAADEIAYSCSDLDDALEHGLITPEELNNIALWHTQPEPVTTRQRRYLIRCLIDHLVEDLRRQSAANLSHADIHTVHEARAHPQRLITFSPATAADIQQLRDFLTQKFYQHPTVSGINRRACEILQRLFAHYQRHPEHLGHQAAARLEQDGPHRTVCDYVAGMTDGYALKMYAKHLGTDHLLKEIFAQSRRDTEI